MVVIIWAIWMQKLCSLSVEKHSNSSDWNALCAERKERMKKMDFIWRKLATKTDMRWREKMKCMPYGWQKRNNVKCVYPVMMTYRDAYIHTQCRKKSILWDNAYTAKTKSAFVFVATATFLSALGKICEEMDWVNLFPVANSTTVARVYQCERHKSAVTFMHSISAVRTTNTPRQYVTHTNGIMQRKTRKCVCVCAHLESYMLIYLLECIEDTHKKTNSVLT